MIAFEAAVLEVIPGGESPAGQFRLHAVLVPPVDAEGDVIDEARPKIPTSHFIIRAPPTPRSATAFRPDSAPLGVCTLPHHVLPHLSRHLGV